MTADELARPPGVAQVMRQAPGPHGHDVEAQVVVAIAGMERQEQLRAALGALALARADGRQRLLAVDARLDLDERQQPAAPDDQVDLAEEVESLGRSDLNTVRSQVQRIIEHLLKLEQSPSAQPRADWRRSVRQARDEIEDHITASMRPDVEADLARLFARGRREAAYGLGEHGEADAAKALPQTCPYSFEQIVGDWYPQNRHGLVDD